MSTARENTPQPWAGLAFTRADRLEKSLSYANVSHQDMADALGVSRQTIGNYTSGRTTRIPKLALKEWALRTGVPLEPCVLLRWRRRRDPTCFVSPKH